MDPNEKPEDVNNVGAGTGATNPTQIQLNPAQVEEAKQMTYGRMKQFRRDRIYTSDRERLQYLTEHLKKIRVMDDQNVYNIGGFSPNRASKNADANRNGSPSKISPTKTTGGNGPKFNDSAHTNNGQVMTQISAIYAKRSRSILNEFGQTNAGGGKHHVNNHGSQQPAYANPSSNANQAQQRGNLNSNQNTNQHNNASNEANTHATDAKQGSPRLGRLRGISPQSREKNYQTSSNQQPSSSTNPAVTSSSANHSLQNG
jgi:hypothetical protein